MICDPSHCVVCIREIQKSLKFSAKKLVEDKIREFGVSNLFEITLTEIRRIGGTGVMIFQGMQDHTADSIKSLEGFNTAWVEEAQSISARSLELLLPTIRAEGSEILFSWNPTNETDPIEKLFKEESDSSICIHINYTQNRLLPQTLKDEAERHLRVSPETFNHVWLGDYKKQSDALIFKNKYRIAELDTTGWERKYFGMDFGFSQDPNAAVRVWVEGTIIYIDREQYGIETEINELHYLIDKLDDRIKQSVLRCDSARPETISYLRNHGYPNATPVKKWAGSVEDGIAFMRSFDIVIHPDCKNLIDEFSRYSYKIDKMSGDITSIIIDAHNHGIDSVRYSLGGLITNKGFFVVSG
jgi:phage terminase large subunit